MKTSLLALLSLGVLASSSPAAVMWSGTQDIAIPTTFDGIYLHVETGANATAPFAGADVNFFFGGEGISNDADSAATVPTLQFVRMGTDPADAARNLAYGETIDATTASFATGFGGSGNPNDHIGTGPGQFEDGVPGYLGFALDVGGGNSVYGYFEVTLTDNGAGIIHSWFAETDINGPITIPEPSGALLSALALGAFATRRRRAPAR